MRLTPDHSSQIKRAAEVFFLVNGEPVRGRPGESVAVALMRSGRMALRVGPVDGGARGMFCGMGLCQECAVRVDGQVVEACRLDVTEGLVVELIS